jgi:hypothetical protein
MVWAGRINSVLRITVELLPGGHEDMKRELAMITATNMTVLAGPSDYAVAVYAREGVNPVAGRGRWESRGMIFEHDRDQSVFALLVKIAMWAAAEAEKR